MEVAGTFCPEHDGAASRAGTTEGGTTMGFADKAKQALGQARVKAAQAADQHGDKVGRAVDRAGDVVDRRTKGRYQAKVGKAQAAAKQATSRLAAEHRAAPRRPVDPGDPATPDHPPR